MERHASTLKRLRSAQAALLPPTVGDLPLALFHDMAYGPFDKNHFHPGGRLCAASRPHRALKFGKQMLTPAMQAGIVSKRLTFRHIFTAVAVIFLCVFMPLALQLQGDAWSAYRKAA